MVHSNVWFKCSFIGVFTFSDVKTTPLTVGLIKLLSPVSKMTLQHIINFHLHLTTPRLQHKGQRALWWWLVLNSKTARQGARKLGLPLLSIASLDNVQVWKLISSQVAFRNRHSSISIVQQPESKSQSIWPLSITVSLLQKTAS